MKRSIAILYLTIAVFLGSAEASFALPECLGTYNKATWSNCTGSTILPEGTTPGNMGDHYRGAWVNGKPEGHGILTGKKNEKFKYIGAFKEGGAHGIGTFTGAAGTTYVGEWKGDKRHGQGTTTFADGARYVGEWKDDKRHGQGTATFVSDNTYTGEWKDGKRNGLGTYIFADGTKSINYWKDGKRARLIEGTSSSAEPGAGFCLSGTRHKHPPISGKCLRPGEEGDYADAFLKWKPLAESGDAIAQLYMGWGYAYSKIFSDDNHASKKWYRLAAAQGNAEAQYVLAAELKFFDVFLATKSAVKEKAIKEVRKLVTLASEQGHSGAQQSRGLSLLQGDHYFEQDYKAAVKWLGLAAKQGRISAYNSLALMYLHGVGVSKDLATAVKMLTRATELGHRDTAVTLGWIYSNGEGFQQDYKTAIKWYTLAASEDHPDAQHNLGVMHALGKGVPKNYKTAIKWFDLSNQHRGEQVWQVTFVQPTVPLRVQRGFYSPVEKTLKNALGKKATLFQQQDAWMQLSFEGDNFWVHASTIDRTFRPVCCSDTVFRADEVNLRSGPGVRFPVKTVAVKKGGKVVVFDKRETWRHIIFEKNKYWVHRAMLAGASKPPEVPKRRLSSAQNNFFQYLLSRSAIGGEEETNIIGLNFSPKKNLTITDLYIYNILAQDNAEISNKIALRNFMDAYIKPKITDSKIADGEKIIKMCRESGQKLCSVYRGISERKYGKEERYWTRLHSAEERKIRENKSKIIADIEFGEYHALIIGNNDYEFLPKLNTAINDAKTLGSVLEKKYGFKTVVLTNASRRDILKSLNKFRKSLKEDDNFLIYYAGHGNFDESTKTGYWQPVDAEITDDTDWIPNSTISRIIKGIAARNVIVVADSCYAGAVFRGLEIVDIDRKEDSQYLKQIIEKKTRVALTSGGNEPVVDSTSGDKHSVFAKVFLKILKTNDVALLSAEISQRLKKEVMDAAASIGVEQTPEYNGMYSAGHDGGDFVFIPRALIDTSD
jgi:TPR repeat protein